MKKAAWTLCLTTLLALAGNLPSYQELCDVLEAPAGWTAAGECEGMKMNNPMMGEMVTASRTFTEGEKKLELSVISGMQAMGMWAPFMTGMEMETNDELIKIEKIEDFEVGISYDKREKSGGIVVRLGSNAIIAGNFENMNWEEALDAMRKIDWKKLQELFGR